MCNYKQPSLEVCEMQASGDGTADTAVESDKTTWFGLIGSVSSMSKNKPADLGSQGLSSGSNVVLVGATGRSR